MKSGSTSSCLGTAFLLVVTLAIVRFTLPAVWKILAGFFAGAIYLGLGIFLILLLGIGYLTYKNLGKNRKKQEQTRYARVTRAEELYRSLLSRMNREMGIHQISAEELLQSEILVTEHLSAIRDDLIRLKDFAAPHHQKEVSISLREYQQQFREAKDSARDVLEQNIRMMEQRRERIDAAIEEIQEKEALMDLVYNSLLDVEEDLKFGRPVQRFFSPDVYRRFGMNPPAEQPSLPPLLERSDE